MNSLITLPNFRYYSTECPITELSFISMQQGHFCLTQTFVTSCLQIGHKHFCNSISPNFFFLSVFNIK